MFDSAAQLEQISQEQIFDLWNSQYGNVGNSSFDVRSTAKGGPCLCYLHGTARIKQPRWQGPGCTKNAGCGLLWARPGIRVCGSRLAQPRDTVLARGRFLPGTQWALFLHVASSKPQTHPMTPVGMQHC